MSFIVPAVLPVSREDLEKKLALCTRLPYVTRVQIDMVDGRFAAPASWPYTIDSSIDEMRGWMLPALDAIEYEIDLMCLDAYQAASTWLARGASRLTFHAESIIDLPRLLTAIQIYYGCGPTSCEVIATGLALNIKSDLSLVEPYLDMIDYVQFMGIARIGRQGQPFDQRVLDRIKGFREKHPTITVQVDGGVSHDTAPALAALGVTNLIVGSAILNAPDPAAAIEELEMLETPYGV